MKRRLTALPLLVSLFVFITVAGCGSNSTSAGNGAAQMVPVSLTATDTPPSGVTVLFSQLSLTSAALQPGNVSLLGMGTTSIPINVSELQTDVAFLSTASVAAGTYNELDLTFAANPQITIFNGSGALVGSGADTCASNTVCILKATDPNPTTLKLTGAPFPVMLSANSPVVLQLDIHLNDVIQSDLTVNLAATNGVSVDRVKDVQTMPLGHLTGAIQTVGTNQFTLATGDGDDHDTSTSTINVNSSTTYSGFPSATGCSAMMQTFSCLAQGQIVKVLVSLQTGGTLLATSVSFVASISQITAEGRIVALSTDSSHNTVMDLILEKGPPLPTGVPNWIFGHRFSVTVSPTAKFAVDSGTFTVPPALASTFTGPSSLLVGQEVQVVVSGTISGITTNAAEADDRDGPLGGADVSFTASSVMLEPSQITGMITTVNPTALSFVINEKFVNFWLPPEPETGAPPVPAPVLVTVDTTTQTVFDGLTVPNQTSFAGLTAGDLVSVDGWLFNTPMGSTATTTTIIVADKVHGRDTDPDL